MHICLSSVTRHLPELASLSSFARILKAYHLLQLETCPNKLRVSTTGTTRTRTRSITGTIHGSTGCYLQSRAPMLPRGRLAAAFPRPACARLSLGRLAPALEYGGLRFAAASPNQLLPTSEEKFEKASRSAGSIRGGTNGVLRCHPPQWQQIGGAIQARGRGSIMQRSARIARHVVGSAPAATEVAELRPVDWPDDIPVPAYVPPRLLGPSSSPLCCSSRQP
jgi:hypothetical protein